MNRRSLAPALVALLIVAATIIVFAQTEQTAVTYSGANPSARGAYKTYLCADPAAGAEITCTVPAGKQWRVLGVQFTFVTSATVNNRNVIIEVDDGTNIFHRTSANLDQAASTTTKYTVNPCLTTQGLAKTVASIPTLCDLHLGPGYRIKTNTVLLDSGDNYGQPVVQVQEWSSTTGN